MALKQEQARQVTATTDPNRMGAPSSRTCRAIRTAGTAKHPGALELAHLVAKLAGGSVNATDRERAVVLALELYRIEEISRMKLLESRGPQDRFRPSSPPQYKPVEDEPLGDL